MFSYGLNFDIDDTDGLIEQTRYLRDIYDSLRQDFEQDNDDSIPQFNIYLRAEVRRTDNGPQMHFEVMNQAHVVAELRDRKEKIEKLLEGIEALALSARLLESEMNSPSKTR